MNQIIAIAIGGAAGSLLRFWMSTGVYALLGRNFPYGTLSVNIFGCLLAGAALVLLTERLDLSAVWRAGILIGVLGGFTTFSAFSMETILLLEQGASLRALAYITASIILCLGATWCGMWIARFF